MKTALPLFVSCSPLLEDLLVEELQSLKLPCVQKGFRGAFVSEWDWSTIYKINYASRLASRVLLPLKKFRCFDARTLYQGVQEIDWTYFFASPKSLAIDANVYHPQIRNGLFAAQVVKTLFATN